MSVEDLKNKEGTEMFLVRYSANPVPQLEEVVLKEVYKSGRNEYVLIKRENQKYRRLPIQRATNRLFTNPLDAIRNLMECRKSRKSTTPLSFEEHEMLVMSLKEKPELWI